MMRTKRKSESGLMMRTKKTGTMKMMILMTTMMISMMMRSILMTMRKMKKRTKMMTRSRKSIFLLVQHTKTDISGWSYSPMSVFL
jgi:hypothetical protein